MSLYHEHKKTVRVPRGALHDVSKFLCRIVDDESQPRQLRDEAYGLNFEISELCVYWGSPGDRDSNVNPGLAFPQFFTGDLEMLLDDLYPDGEPHDIRSLRILLARGAAADADDGLKTIDCRMESLAVLDEVIAGIKRDAEDGDDAMRIREVTLAVDDEQNLPTHDLH